MRARTDASVRTGSDPPSFGKSPADPSRLAGSNATRTGTGRTESMLIAAPDVMQDLDLSCLSAVLVSGFPLFPGAFAPLFCEMVEDGDASRKPADEGTPAGGCGEDFSVTTASVVCPAFPCADDVFAGSIPDRTALNETRSPDDGLAGFASARPVEHPAGITVPAEPLLPGAASLTIPAVTVPACALASAPVFEAGTGTGTGDVAGPIDMTDPMQFSCQICILLRNGNRQIWRRFSEQSAKSAGSKRFRSAYSAGLSGLFIIILVNAAEARLARFMLCPNPHDHVAIFGRPA